MSKVHKEASKRLGLALETRYRNLALAHGENEIAIASVDLGQLFNDNIEFIINVLRDYGGLEARFEPMTRPVVPANDTPAKPALPPMPAIFAAGADVDKARKK